MNASRGFSPSRSRMKPTFALAACILLALAPSVAASDGFAASLEAMSLESQGQGLVKGQLVAFLQEDAGATDQPTLSGFSLTSAETRIETDSAEPTIRAGVLAQRVQPETTTAEYESSAFDGISFKEGFRWNVFSLNNQAPAEVEIQSACSKVVPHGTSSIERVAIVNSPGRELTIRDTSESFALSCREEFTVTVTGDFVLSLWSVDASILADGNAWTLRTGPQQATSAPAGTPDLSSRVSRDVEAYIFARNATLTVPALQGNYLLLLDSMHVESSSALLHGATGTVHLPDGATALDHQVVWLGDDSILQLARQPGSQVLQVDARTSELRFGQRTLTAAPTDNDTGPWPIVGLALLLLVLVLAGGQVRLWRVYARFSKNVERFETPPSNWRELRGAAYYILGNNALHAGRLKRAGRLAKRSQRLFPTSVEGLLLRAGVHRLTGNLDAALKDLEDAYDQLHNDADKADVACCIAGILVQLDLADEAVDWLKDAATHDITTFESEAKRKCFDALANDPWFEGARLGAVRDEQNRRHGLWG